MKRPANHDMLKAASANHALDRGQFPPGQDIGASFGLLFFRDAGALPTGLDLRLISKRAKT